MRTLILLLLFAASFQAAEINLEPKVTISAAGNTIRLFVERDKRELFIMRGTISMVVPPVNEFDNNQYTAIFLNDGTTVLRLLQRNNPGADVVSTISRLDPSMVRLLSDRYNENDQVYLVSLKNISLIERPRIQNERGDTNIFFHNANAIDSKVVINQSAEAYNNFMKLVMEHK
jgi:hypothetical protein